MDFELSEEHRMIIDGAKKFAEKELAPLAAEYDEKQETNIAALKELGELGYLGMTVPDQYGGAGGWDGRRARAPGHIRATAVRDGNDVILNGTKNFTTNGGFADVIIAFFSTDKDKGAKGISAFLISKDTPGFEVGKHENKLGIRSSTTTELVFTDCRVPAGSLLGQENKGLSIALATLDCGRIGIGATGTGIAAAALA